MGGLRDVFVPKFSPKIYIVGFPPEFFLQCDICNKKVAKLSFLVRLTRTQAINARIEEAKKYMDFCSTCNSWVCHDCFEKETNRCIRCFSNNYKGKQENVSNAFVEVKFCTNCGNSIRR